MRILKVKFCNLNSLKGWHKIVFRCLLSLILLPILTSCNSDFERSKTKRIAIVFPQKVSENPFWQRIKLGAEKAAHDLDIELLVFYGEQHNVDQEIIAIEKAIEKQPDGLLIPPSHPNLLVPIVEKAIAQNIPVIVYDAPLNSDKIITEIRFDGTKGGYSIGKWVSEQLGGTGKVLILDGVEGRPERRQGFEQGLSTSNIEILDIKLAGWKREEAHSITLEWLRQFEQIDAILAANDDMALGAADAVFKMNRKDIIITGIDGNPNALQAIKENNIHATIDQDPSGIGYHIVELMEQYLRNDKPLPSKMKWQKTPLINHQNISQHLNTNVVHTGIKINEIKDFNLDSFTVFFDFILWFRYQNDVFDEKVPENIVFLNAVKPINLENPIYKEEIGTTKYVAYHINGDFKANFLPSRHFLDNHVIGIMFRHKHFDKKNIFYTPDFLGMDITKHQTLVKQLKDINIFNLGQDWIISEAKIFEENIKTNSLGRASYLQQNENNTIFSQFHLVIWIEAFSLRGKITNSAAIYLFFFCIIAQLLVYVYEKRHLKNNKVFLWLLKIILIIVNWLSIEILIITYITTHVDNYYFLRNAVYGFDILWWLIFSYIILLAIQNFVWIPIEQKTNQKIPRLARNSVSFIIYLLAIFGIVAFVFDQKLTGLLATSGMLAMIIGLAIQINISNIFSGLALSIEKPFQVGDEIKIGDFDTGYVLDITWRTIKIRTDDNILLSIPNSLAAESPIQNLTHTITGVYTLRIIVHINSEDVDNNVVNVLEKAILSVEHILPDPPPQIIFQGVNQITADYLLECFIDNYQNKDICTENIWKNIVIQMKKAGIPFAKQYQIIRF